MEKTNHVLKPDKLQRLLELMDKTAKGVRRIHLYSIERKRTKKAQFE